MGWKIGPFASKAPEIAVLFHASRRLRTGAEAAPADRTTAVSITSARFSDTGSEGRDCSSIWGIITSEIELNCLESRGFRGDARAFQARGVRFAFQARLRE